MLLGVLGPLEVSGRPADLERRDRVVLSVLIVRNGRTVLADELADALWPLHPPRTWAKVVQGAIVRIRRRLGAETITSLGGGYRLDIAADEIDATRFEQLVHRARGLQRVGDAAGAFDVFTLALALWRGTAFADLLDWGPGRDESTRLDEIRQLAEEERVITGIEAGRASDLVADAQALVGAAPERERRWVGLAIGLYASGRQVEAIDTVRAAAARLRETYGIEPGGGLAELELAMLRHDPRLDVGGPTAPVTLPSATELPGTAGAPTRSRRRAAVVAVGGAVITIGSGAAAFGARGHDTPVIGSGEPWVAYTAPGDSDVGELVAVRPDGSGAHPLLAARLPVTGEMHKPDWSPDGQQVAFEVLGLGAGTPPATVWVVGADGTDAREVAACDRDPCRQFSEPAWSPDGTSLAMVRFDLYRDGSCCTSRLIVLDLDSGVMRSVYEVIDEAPDDSYDVIYSPTWSPDGSELAFTLERYGILDPYPFVDSRIAIVSSKAPATQEPRFITDPAMDAWHPDWAPTDDAIVFSTSDPDRVPVGARSDLYLVRSDGAGLRRLTDSTHDGAVRYLTPTWSPDGTEVLLAIAHIGSGGTVADKVIGTLTLEGGRPVPIGGGLRGNDATLRPVAATVT